MTKIIPPKIHDQKFSDILKILEGLAPHYTPEWAGSDEKDAGVALLNIFAHITETIINRLNRVPHKNFVAFLDMLGIKLLHAQPAWVPLTFKLAEGTERDVWIPARTQAATDKTEEHEELPFETEKNLLATISNLKELISVDPHKDAIYVQTPYVISEDGKVLDQQAAFTVFSGTDHQEHSLYLGHKDLFNIESAGQIIFEITFAPGTEVAASRLSLVWEYWGEDKAKKKDEWIPLQVLQDRTNGFKQSGKIDLYKTKEGEIKEEKLGEIFKKTSRVEIKNDAVGEVKTRWIRCRLEDRLTLDSFIRLPAVDCIFIRIKPSEPILPDAMFFNDVPLDLTLDPNDANEPKKLGARIAASQRSSCKKHFLHRVYPFGKQPRLYDSFYVGSQEVLSKKGASVTICLILAHDETSSNTPEPTLSWEYWDGKGWRVLPGLKDSTKHFMNTDGNNIQFRVPLDMAETEVSGQRNYWVRARLVAGNYGKEEYTLALDTTRTADVDTTRTAYKLETKRQFKIPFIRSLMLEYSFEKKENLQCALTYNNLDFQDKSSACQSKDEFLDPFIRMEDTDLVLYLGFDNPLRSGPIRIFFAAQELSYKEEKKPKMDWNYRDKKGWALLDYLDETEGLIIRGHLEFIGGAEFTPDVRFGQSLYWVQGRLAKGTYESLPKLRGIYPNTTWALQAETIRDEILGSCDGEPDQTFKFSRLPVLEGQEIRVRETLSEEEKKALTSLFGEEAIFELRDETGKVTETWVLWSEVPDLFDATEESRHYTLDRATGQLQFGNGKRGMIPPAGDDNMKAFSYQAGGGAQGNVKALEIKSLKSAVAGVDKVSNPVAADGGADTATLDQMLEIGPAMIGHRGRAVTAEDFEWLAKQASRKVVKARCLPNINNKKQTEVGWVTVVIVPDSMEPKPTPSLELRTRVRQYLENICANTLSSRKHVHVDRPAYVEIGVSVDVFIPSVDVAAQVERAVRRELDAFLHPLTGGPEGKGWDFGRDVSVSDVYALLEGIKDVDHVENLRFFYNGKTAEEIVEVKEGFLVATGSHKINLQLAHTG